MIPITDELRADADPAFARPVVVDRHRYRCATCDRLYNRAWWHTLVWWHRAKRMSVAYEWANIVIKPVDNASYALDRMTAAFRNLSGDVLDWTLQARAARNRDLWKRMRYAAGLS